MSDRTATTSRWRVAVRVAWREVRRHWVRSALVVLVVAVPVLAAQAASLYWGSVRQNLAFEQPLTVWSPEDAGADERTGFDPRLGPPPAVEGAEQVATGFAISDWTPSAGHGIGPDDLQQVRIVGFVPGRSDIDLRQGREPRTRHEVVVTDDLATEADLDVGDGMEAVASGVELTVVGISHLDGPATATAWAGPPVDDADDWVPTTLARMRDSGNDLVTADMFDLYWLTPEARAARGLGPAAAPDEAFRYEEGATSAGPRVGVTEVVVTAALAAIAVGFVATTASAAFAIGARRQVRQLGTLAAVGAAPADLLRAVVLQGTVLGAVGAAMATVLVYVGRFVVVRRWLDDTTWTVPFQPSWVGAAAVLGVVAGTAAAAVPALTASRIPVLSALGGARPVRRHRLRSPWVGLAVIAVGLAGLSWASAGNRGDGGAEVSVAALGALAVMAGAAAVSPGLVALAGRLSARTRGTVRLAGRTLVRDGMRSAAIVAATAVALAIPVVVLVYGAREPERGLGPSPEVRAYWDRVDDAHTHTTRVEVVGPGDEEEERATDEVVALLGDDALVARALVLRVDEVAGPSYAVPPDGLRAATGDDAVADALESGAVVRLARHVDRSEAYATFGSVDDMIDRTGARVVEVAPDAVAPLTLALLADAGAVGITAPLPTDPEVTHSTVVAVDRTVPDAVERRIDALGTDGTPLVSRAALTELAPGAGSADAVWVSVIESYTEPDPLPWVPITLVASLVVALLVIGTASALAAADGREDDRVVAAVGAPPTVVRRRRALEAAFTAGAAATLAVGLGTTATMVVLHHPLVAGPDRGPVRLPVLDLASLAVGAVAVVGGATWVVLAGSGRLRGRTDLTLET